MATLAKYALILWSVVALVAAFFEFYDTTFPLNPPPGVHGEEHMARQGAKALRHWATIWIGPAVALYLVHRWRRVKQVDEEEERDAAYGSRPTAGAGFVVRRGSPLTSVRKAIFNVTNLRGLIGILVFLGLLEVAGHLEIPVIGRVPPPSAVIRRFIASDGLLWRDKYWASWVISLFRIFSAFVAALIVGIPQGLAWGVSRTTKAAAFPVFEMFRPIPPLAFLPVAIYLMPTSELSIIFVIFLGTYFTIVINTINGVYNVDLSYRRAALSLGAKRSDIFWKIILPGTLPSIITGATVGMGISWMELVAAEMIAGRAGLGFLTWESYTGGDIAQVVVGMASMGIGGALCSAVIWKFGGNLMPWRRLF
jgi:NitT/TauT family transport system permease protein